MTLTVKYKLTTRDRQESPHVILHPVLTPVRRRIPGDRAGAQCIPNKSDQI